MENEEDLKLAEVEDRMWYFRPLHGHVQWTLDESGVRAEARLFDAGCGTGGLIRRMAGQCPGWRWTGVDLSPMMRRFAREQVKAGAEICEAAVMWLRAVGRRSFGCSILAMAQKPRATQGG